MLSYSSFITMSLAVKVLNEEIDIFSNHFNPDRSFSRLFHLLLPSKIFSGVVTFELLQQMLFSVLETDSWFDTLSCLLAYAFVICLLSVTLFIPLLLSVLTLIFS